MHNDLERCSFVFVYGTLMSGYGNSRILKAHNATLVGPRVTQDKYVLGNVGFPYLFKPESVKYLLNEELDDYSKPVVGELWTIPSESCLKALDSLEGYPSHYDREVISLKTGEEAWTYVQPNGQAINHCYECNVTEQNEWSWRW